MPSRTHADGTKPTPRKSRNGLQSLEELLRTKPYRFEMKLVLSGNAQTPAPNHTLQRFS